jgi:hypothetical protein
LIIYVIDIVAQIPFGGCGASGMGCYRGKASFDAFSHKRSILHSGNLDEPVRFTLLYPPYNIKRIPLFMFGLSRYSSWNLKLKKVSLLVLVLVLFGIIGKERGLF